MSFSQTENSLTPRGEEDRCQRLVAGQMEDFNPQRTEEGRMADDEGESAYVEGEKRREGVEVWECKSLPFFLLFFLFLFLRNIYAYPTLQLLLR